MCHTKTSCHALNVRLQCIVNSRPVGRWCKSSAGSWNKHWQKVPFWDNKESFHETSDDVACLTVCGVKQIQE